MFPEVPAGLLVLENSRKAAHLELWIQRLDRAAPRPRRDLIFYSMCDRKPGKALSRKATWL